MDRYEAVPLYTPNSATIVSADLSRCFGQAVLIGCLIWFIQSGSICSHADTYDARRSHHAVGPPSAPHSAHGVQVLELVVDALRGPLFEEDEEAVAMWATLARRQALEVHIHACSWRGRGQCLAW